MLEKTCVTTPKNFREFLIALVRKINQSSRDKDIVTKINQSPYGKHTVTEIN